MVIQLIPTLAKIGTQLGPIILHELSRPRTRRLIRGFAEQGLEVAFRKGKERLRSPAKGTKKTFIMRRGRKRFQCRQVK